MKVIHSNKYLLVGVEDGWLKFISNPSFSKFDEEIILVKRARYVVERNGVFFSNVITPDNYMVAM